MRLTLDVESPLASTPYPECAGRHFLRREWCSVKRSRAFRSNPELLWTKGRRSILKARRSRGDDSYGDYVELDDEGPRFSLDYLPVTGGRILRSLQNVVDRFVDVAYDVAPSGTSRAVVETTTKGALLLVTIAFASSILSFLLNAGFIVLGIYVATRVFGLNIGSFGSPPKGSLGPGQERPGRQTSGQRGASQPKGNARGFRTDFGRAADDLTDVWFERKPPPDRQRPPRRK